MRYWREFPSRLRNGMNVTRVGPIDRLRAGMLSFCESASIAALDIPPTDGPGLVLCHAGIAEDIERQGHVPSISDEPRAAFWDFVCSVKNSLQPAARRIEGKVAASAIVGGRPFKVFEGRRLPHIGGVTIAEGAFVDHGTVIDNGIYGEDTEIRECAQIDNLCHIAHSVIIGKGATVVAGSIIGGWCEIGEGARIVSAKIRDGVNVGAGATVGWGAVVVKDVPPGVTVMGVPARPQ